MTEIVLLMWCPSPPQAQLKQINTSFAGSTLFQSYIKLKSFHTLCHLSGFPPLRLRPLHPHHHHNTYPKISSSSFIRRDGSELQLYPDSQMRAIFLWGSPVMILSLNWYIFVLHRKKKKRMYNSGTFDL